MHSDNGCLLSYIVWKQCTSYGDTNFIRIILVFSLNLEKFLTQDSDFFCSEFERDFYIKVLFWLANLDLNFGENLIFNKNLASMSIVNFQMDDFKERNIQEKIPKRYFTEEVTIALCNAELLYAFKSFIVLEISFINYTHHRGQYRFHWAKLCRY